MRARLDTTLVARGLVESREKAKRHILAGTDRVNGQLAAKASDMILDTATIEVAGAERFVSRGGYKLEAAVDAFQIDCVDDTHGYLLDGSAILIRRRRLGQAPKLCWCHERGSQHPG